MCRHAALRCIARERAGDVLLVAERRSVDFASAACAVETHRDCRDADEQRGSRSRCRRPVPHDLVAPSTAASTANHESRVSAIQVPLWWGWSNFPLIEEITAWHASAPSRIAATCVRGVQARDLMARPIHHAATAIPLREAVGDRRNGSGCAQERSVHCS